MDIATVKAPKYNARAGEVIAGNLARGGDGKFTRADGSNASGSEVIAALTKKPKAGKKGGKSAGASPAQQDALAQKVGLQKGDSAALAQFAKGGALDSATAQRLADSGLVEIAKDGAVRFSDSGKSVARALAKGDERSAADAMSRARDRKSAGAERDAKKAQAQAERDARRAESQSRRDAAKADRDKRNAERDAAKAEREQKREQADAARTDKRNARELQTVTDRVEEIGALQGADKNVTEPERVRRLNQLDKLEKRLADAGGDAEAQAAIDDLRKVLEAPAEAREPAPRPSRSKFREASDSDDSGSALAVFKSGDTWRWLGVSSTAYKDRESEIVSRAALESDAERMSASGEYGPLRFWHVGKIDIANPLDYLSVKAGSGVDIGSCDYSEVFGNMALEGGEIFAQEIAAVLAAEPGAWQMSRGFAHPPNEPGAAGVYTQIKTFERSILPTGKAANPFTTVSATKEANDMASIQEKMKVLAEKFFGGDEAKAGELIAAVSATDKEISESGVAFKASESGGEPETDEAPAETPADAAPEMETKADAVEVEAEAETDSEPAGFVGDMTAEEFISVLVPALADAIANAMAGAMAPTMQELDATKEALATAQKEIAALKSTKEKEARISDAVITAIEARVKELEGDAPTGARGYRASESADSATERASIAAKELTSADAPATEAQRLGSWAIG